MRRLHRATAALATSAFLVALATAARAQRLKTSQEIMDFSTSKTSAYKTWSADYTQTMSMFGGQMNVNGQMIQKPPHQMRVQADMPMMGQQSKVTMVMGDDGVMWEVMDMGPQHQIIKMDMSKVMSNATAQTGMMVNPLKQMDPSKQWETSKQLIDFNVAKSQELDGQPMYVMEGGWKQVALTNQQMAMVVGLVGKMRVFIGQNDGFLHRVEEFDKSKTNLVMTMELKNLKFNQNVPDSTFVYHPPTNAPVMDMTPMLEMQMRAGNKAPTPPPAPEPPATPPAPAATPSTP